MSALTRSTQSFLGNSWYLGWADGKADGQRSIDASKTMGEFPNFPSEYIKGYLEAQQSYNPTNPSFKLLNP